MTTQPPLIAVVDDEATVRTMLRRTLEVADYAVATFEDGPAFLAQLGATAPDCVVLDVHMPGLSGLGVRDRLRALGVHVPVVFITASDDVDAGSCLAGPADIEVLRKPFTSHALLHAVLRAVAGHPDGADCADCAACRDRAGGTA